MTHETDKSWKKTRKSKKYTLYNPLELAVRFFVAVLFNFLSFRVTPTFNKMADKDRAASFAGNTWSFEIMVDLITIIIKKCSEAFKFLQSSTKRKYPFRF